MLVLSRKVGEVIRINDNISVVVVRIQGNTIKLGVQAPRDVPVRRFELEKRERGGERD